MYESTEIFELGRNLEYSFTIWRTNQPNFFRVYAILKTLQQVDICINWNFLRKESQILVRQYVWINWDFFPWVRHLEYSIAN